MVSPEEKERLEKTGNLLRVLRIEKKLSQKQLAFEIGVSRSQYQYMESGEANFGILTLYRLAEALEVDPTVLIVSQEN